MSNMSYCKFRNTLSDLQDCRDSLGDDLSPEEKNAKDSLLRVCADILEQEGWVVEEP